MHVAAPPPNFRNRLLAEPGVAAAFKAVDRILSRHPTWNHERDDLEGIAALAAAKVASGPPPRNLEAYCYVAARNDCWEYLNAIREFACESIPVDRLRRRPCELEDDWRNFMALEELLACCGDDPDRDIVRLRTMAARYDAGDPITLEEIGEIVSLDKSNVSRRIAAIEARFRARNKVEDFLRP